MLDWFPCFPWRLQRLQFSPTVHIYADSQLSLSVCVCVCVSSGVSLLHGDWLRQSLWSWWGRRGEWLERSRFTHSAKYCSFSTYHHWTQPDKPCDLCINDGKTFLIHSSSVTNIFSSNHGRRWCQAICRNTLDGLTDSPSKGANTHSHTPRGKQRNKNPWGWFISTHLLHFLCIPHPPACFLSFVIVSQIQWSRHRFIRTMSFHLASLRRVGRVIFSGCFDTGHRWIKDTFQDKFSSSSSSFFSSASLLILLMMQCTVLTYMRPTPLAEKCRHPGSSKATARSTKRLVFAEIS